MYRHARRVLEELLTQHPLTYQCHSRSLSNEPVPEHGSKSAKHKAVPRAVRIRTIQIHKDKKVQEFTKGQVVLLYTLLCNKLVNPFLDLITPGIKREDQLSNLTDFRKEQWPFTIDSKGNYTNCTECLEKPSPFKLKKILEIEDCIIKDPRSVLKDKIKKKVNFARIKINELDYVRNLKSIVQQARSDNEQGNLYSASYKIFLKRKVDSKVESLTPNLYGGNLTRLCDFRTHDEAFSLGQSQEKFYLGGNPLMAQTFSSIPVIKRNINEVQVKDDKTSSPPLHFEIENVSGSEMQAVPKKVTENMKVPKSNELTPLDTNQIIQYSINSLNNVSNMPSTSLKPQVNLDQAKTCSIIDSDAVLGISSTANEDSEVTNDTKQTMINNPASMKTVPSSEKGNVANKTKLNKNLPIPFKVKAKNDMNRVINNRKTIKTNEEEVPWKVDKNRTNSSNKRITHQNKSKEGKHTRDEAEKKSDVGSLTAGQRNKKKIKYYLDKTGKPTTQTEKLVKKNKIHSNLDSFPPTSVRRKLEHGSQKNLNTKENLEGTIKLKDRPDVNTKRDENSPLFEEANSKNKLINSTNKPKFVVKRNQKTFQISKTNYEKKKLGKGSFSGPSKVTLVTFKAKAEEPYFVTKEKSLKGVQSDLISLADVIETEEKALKSQSSISVENKNTMVNHKNSTNSIEDKRKRLKQLKQRESKTDTLKSYELVHMQSLSAIDIPSTFDFRNQKIKDTSNKHADITKKCKDQTKQPLTVSDDSKKQVHTQTVLSNKNQHESKNQFNLKQDDFKDKIKHQHKNQFKTSNATLNDKAQIDLKDTSAPLAEKINYDVNENNVFEHKVLKTDIESFKVSATNKVKFSQTSKNFNQVSNHGFMDLNGENKQNASTKINLRDNLNSQKLQILNQRETSANNPIETTTGTKSKITTKRKSVEGNTKGLINKREKVDESKHLRFDQDALKAITVNGITQTSRISDKKTMSQEIDSSKDIEFEREEAKVITLKKSLTHQKSRSLDKISKPEVLDSNFELNKEVSRKISKDSGKKIGMSELLNSNNEAKGPLKVPKPQFDREKEGMRLVKDKQKESLSELSKKRDERFNLLKNDTRRSIDSKIEVINKKVSNENIKPTTKSSISENNISRNSSFNKWETANKGPALQNLKKDNVENQRVAKPGEKGTFHVWNTKSEDQTASLKKLANSRLNESLPVTDKKVNSPIAKTSGNSSKKLEKITSVDNLSTVIKTEKLDDNELLLKNALNVGKQQNPQYDKYNLSSSSNIFHGTTTMHDESIGNTEKVKRDISINNNAKKVKNNDFTVNGQSMKINASKNILEQSVTTSKGDKLTDKGEQKKQEVDESNFTQSDGKNDLAELKLQAKILRTGNVFQRVPEKSKGSNSTKNSKVDEFFGKNKQIKLEVQKNDHTHKEDKDKLDLKLEPTDLKTGNVVQKASENSKGNISSNKSELGELTGKGEQKILKIQKIDQTQSEDKNKVADLKLQPTNLKTGNELQKVPENPRGNEPFKNSKVDELICKDEQSILKIQKNEHNQMEYKNKIDDFKLQQTNLEKENTLQKLAEKSKGNDATDKNSKVDDLIIKGEQCKLKMQKINHIHKEEENNVADVKLQQTNLNTETALQKAAENSRGNDLTNKTSKVDALIINGEQSKLKIQKFDHTQKGEKNEVSGLNLQQTNLKTGNVFQKMSENSKENKSSTNYNDEVVAKDEQSKFGIQRNDNTQREERKNVTEFKFQPSLKKENNLQNNLEHTRRNASDEKISKEKFYVPKYDYDKSKVNKVKAFEYKSKAPNSMTKNKSLGSSKISKGDVVNVGTNIQSKFEGSTKYALREENRKTAEVKTQSTNLKTKNLPHQTNTKWESSQPAVIKQFQSPGKNNELNSEVQKLGNSQKKENTSKADSLEKKQQKFSQQTTNSFKATNLSIKKSVSVESIAKPSQKQTTELSGSVKTTLERTSPHIVQAKSVKNMEKDQKNNVSDMNVNENSSLSKHRPIAKISVPILPNIKEKAKLNVENKINGKVQADSVSKDQKTTQELQNMGESQSDINPVRRIKKSHW